MSGYVSAEISAATLRFHPSGYGYGSPYTNVCRVSEHPEFKGEAVIAAFEGHVGFAVRHQFAHKLMELGFTTARFKIKGRWHTYSLDRWAE